MEWNHIFSALAIRPNKLVFFVELPWVKHQARSQVTALQVTCRGDSSASASKVPVIPPLKRIMVDCIRHVSKPAVCMYSLPIGFDSFMLAAITLLPTKLAHPGAAAEALGAVMHITLADPEQRVLSPSTSAERDWKKPSFTSFPHASAGAAVRRDFGENLAIL
mmetsp:Transcript_43720/g.72657  ORF Transcript_43720/g.72657 Transcript_43720/m.72657 type:complete len:163 (+) Transcript_43720:893-1381(+)